MKLLSLSLIFDKISFGSVTYEGLLVFGFIVWIGSFYDFLFGWVGLIFMVSRKSKSTKSRLISFFFWS